jgi:phage protein U
MSEKVRPRYVVLMADAGDRPPKELVDAMETISGVFKVERVEPKQHPISKPGVAFQYDGWSGYSFWW